MWGRLDGAGWIVHMLVSPQRLMQLRDASSDIGGFFDSFVKQLLALTGEANIPSAVSDELASLLEPTGAAIAMPSVLEQTPLWLAACVQKLIAAEELAYVAQQLDVEAGDIPANADEAAFLDLYRRSTGLAGDQPMPASPPVVPAAVAPELLRACLVSKETMKSQEKSPLFIRTAVKAAAVAAATVAAMDTRPPPMLQPALTLARQSTRAAYEIVSRITKGRDFRTAVVAIVFFVIGVGLATSSTSIVGLGGAFFIAVGIVLAVASMWRASIWLAGLVVVLATLAVILAGLIPGLRDHVFPWLSLTAIPWLSAHGIVWAAIVLLVLLPPITTVIGVIQAHRPRRTIATAPPASAANTAPPAAGQPASR
jgi:hypothetical protein